MRKTVGLLATGMAAIRAMEMSATIPVGDGYTKKRRKSSPYKPPEPDHEATLKAAEAKRERRKQRNIALAAKGAFK